MKIIFILPIIFCFSFFCKAFAQVNLRLEENILKSNFFELELDGSWVTVAVTDIGLNIATATLSEGFSTEFLVTSEYEASIFLFLDHKLNKDIEYTQTLGGEILRKQYFISSSGSQAYGLQYQVETKGVTETYYKFHFDGTTTGYTGNDEQWLSVSVLLSDLGLNQNKPTYEEAKNIANKLQFTEGNPDPNKILPELENLQIGDSINLDLNNSNDQSESIISLTRNIKNGPLSFFVSEDTNVNILETYHEFDSRTVGQLALIYDPSQSIAPAIAVGLDRQSQFSITADASYPATSMHIFTDFENKTLDQWASIQQSSWKNSPNGRIYSSAYFTTPSGFQGISIVRETGITRDYYIGIDLKNDAWESRNSLNYLSENLPLLRLQISGFNDPVKNGFYPTALQIAKTFDFNQSVVTTLPLVTEINTSYGNDSNQSLDRIIKDGPISFSIPAGMQTDWNQAYIERESITKAQYNLNDVSNLISTNIVAYTEERLKSLDEWASYQQATWTSEDKGSLVSTQKFTTDDGEHNGIAIVRQLGTVRDFFIALDVSTDEWTERYDESDNALDHGWLKILMSGFQDPVIDGFYPVALSIAKSFEYDDSFEPQTNNTFNETTTSHIETESELNSTITDGPIEFLVKENTVVDFFENYNESNISTNAKYNLSLATTDSFKSLVIESEDFYSNLSDWAYYQKYAWENSDPANLTVARSFTTDYNSTGVLLIRENNSTRDFKIVIDLTNQAWKDRHSLISISSEDSWLRAEFTSSNNPLHNPILDETLASAKSLHFTKTDAPTAPIFREISHLTLFRSGKLASSWYISDWFGTFFETDSDWIYHGLLGWMYAIEVTPTSGWFWHEGFDWLWTSESAYPYFYSYDTGDWLFFDHKFLKEKKYYDFKQKKWVILDLLQKILDDYAGDEDETIIRIMKSSLLEKEKLNGIGGVILYGN